MANPATIIVIVVTAGMGIVMAMAMGVAMVATTLTITTGLSESVSWVGLVLVVIDRAIAARKVGASLVVADAIVQDTWMREQELKLTAAVDMFIRSSRL